MEIWIVATLAAALFQTLRFALQKRLTMAGLSAAGATWSRFLWAAPLLVTGVWAYCATTGASLPALTPRFWLFAMAGGIAQILATLCVVALFSLRNFAVGITLKKTEVLQTVLVGWIILGETVSVAGFAAMVLGLLALLLLSDRPALAGQGGPAFLNRAMVLGVISGALFACSGVGYRGAVLALGDAPAGFRAAVALACVTSAQTLLMGLWFALRDRAQIGKVLRSWRSGLATSLAGLLGSLGWFIAFAFQTPAYVFALGQIELVFSILGGALFFGERLSRREYAGIGLLMVSLVALVLTA